MSKILKVRLLLHCSKSEIELVSIFNTLLKPANLFNRVKEKLINLFCFFWINTLIVSHLNSSYWHCCS